MFIKGYKQTEEHKRRIGDANKISLIGQRHSPSTEFKKGMTSWLKGKKLGFIPKGAFKAGMIPWNKGLKGFRAGSLHHNWQGGITSDNDKARNSLELKLWKKAVFERDDYTCVWCHKRGGRLNADHILPFCLFPEKRVDINNGRTLCISCHQKTNTFAGRVRNFKVEEGK